MVIESSKLRYSIIREEQENKEKETTANVEFDDE